jgi:hypothetical protein
MRSRLLVRCSLLAAALAVLVPSSASADATAFIGANATPSNRLAKGFAAGISLVIVGFEFEYSSTNEDLPEAAPSLRTFMGNAYLQTPFPISGLQPYFTMGGGAYRERLGSISETNVGANVGGGVRISLAGPLRLRVDYRVFTLKGNPLHSKPQRVYTGLNLAF